MLTRVTITGADDQTDIPTLMHISKEFPFVEWGILASRRQIGTKRFPTSEWANQFAHVCFHNPDTMKLSMHMCGGWVRELLLGTLHWEELPKGLLAVAQRIQINTHAEDHVSRTAMCARMLEEPQKTFIFQMDDVNNHLVYGARAYGVHVNALFDCSHGAGVLPSGWPRSLQEIPCGYAGGLGPENVSQQLLVIERAGQGRDFWIDMEGRVRDENGDLDLNKVRKVLELCAPLINTFKA